MNKLELMNPEVVKNLPERGAPYWMTLEYCRHIGVSKRPGRPHVWMARVRTKSGKYKRCQLDCLSVSFPVAYSAAQSWFSRTEIMQVASPPYPIGVNRELRYSKIISGFTIGDALADYVEWKRISAARTHFETNLSLINYHIIPRLGHVLAKDLTGRLFTEFCRDVLETPPKRGKQPLGAKCDLDKVPADQLRKRKKTLNALIGILRLALQMAWENGEIEDDRSWRCLRRVPSSDVPRQVFLSRKGCRALLSSCRPDLANLILGALYTGCRVGELAALTVRDVEPSFAGIYVSPQKSRRGRYVHLPDEGLQFFRSMARDKGAEELVFRMSSGRAWSGGNHKHLFRDAVRRAGLPADFVFHGLRHTYASQLVEAGASLVIVARQLGHASTDTVGRTYGHVSEHTIERAISTRFAPLIHPAPHDTPTAERSAEELTPNLRTSATWPRSNFSRSGTELTKFLRMIENPGDQIDP
ncbi:tyrosine-type recombinase/integrase [Albibacillus kandeliae]|uniref:tyrosine-type recombinase/integrase n=1 Tax=Albibacillus kandeliae TaxID=2174228 RepID=UPI000D69B8CF